MVSEMSNFSSIDALVAALEAAGYYADRRLATAVFLALKLQRPLLLEGEPLGAILRVPRADEARSNIHVGGSVVACDLDADDRRIIAAVAPRLRADGLHFVGLDVIGGRLTEVNVTSPTGIQELSRFTGSQPEAKVLAWIESRVRSGSH